MIGCWEKRFCNFVNTKIVKTFCFNFGTYLMRFLSIELQTSLLINIFICIARKNTIFYEFGESKMKIKLLIKKVKSKYYLTAYTPRKIINFVSFFRTFHAKSDFPRAQFAPQLCFRPNIFYVIVCIFHPKALQNSTATTRRNAMRLMYSRLEETRMIFIEAAKTSMNVIRFEFFSVFYEVF